MWTSLGGGKRGLGLLSHINHRHLGDCEGVAFLGLGLPTGAVKVGPSSPFRLNFLGAAVGGDGYRAALIPSPSESHSGVRVCDFLHLDVGLIQ